MLKHDPLAPGGDKKPPVITWAALDEGFQGTLQPSSGVHFEAGRTRLRASKRLKVWI